MAKKPKVIYGGDLTAARLCGLRVFLKKTVKNLSKKTGLPEKYIEEIESGEADPPVLHIKSLLDAMNVQADNVRFTRCKSEDIFFSIW